MIRNASGHLVTGEIVQIANLADIDFENESMTVIHSHQFNPILNQPECRDSFFPKSQIKFITVVTSDDNNNQHTTH